MTEEFGSGIALDEHLDFSIDNTGDLDTVSGAEELEKDLAINMMHNLQQYIGQPRTNRLDSKVLGTAKNVALADVRVDDVDEGDASVEWSHDSRDLMVHLPVVAGDEEYVLVFDV